MTAERESLIRRTLVDIATALDPAIFRQRSTIININAVAGVRRDIGRRMRLRLKARPETLIMCERHAHLFTPT